MGFGVILFSLTKSETSLSSPHLQTAPQQQSLVLCWPGLWGHSHRRKEGRSKEYKGDVCLWRRKKGKSFILIPKNHHLRNYEKLPGLGYPKKTKESHLRGFSVFFFFFLPGACIHISYSLRLCFQSFFFFFSSRVKILQAQLNQMVGSALRNSVFLAQPSQPGPAWGGLVPERIWDQGDFPFNCNFPFCFLGNSWAYVNCVWVGSFIQNKNEIYFRISFRFCFPWAQYSLQGKD